MAHAEDVEDIGGLDGTLPETVEVNPAPPSDVGEGPSTTPAPTTAGEDLAPAPAPTCEDASKAVAELGTEDPATAAEPS
jgi:hypothetical protein